MKSQTWPPPEREAVLGLPCGRQKVTLRNWLVAIPFTHSHYPTFVLITIFGVNCSAVLVNFPSLGGRHGFLSCWRNKYGMLPYNSILRLHFSLMIVLSYRLKKKLIQCLAGQAINRKQTNCLCILETGNTTNDHFSRMNGQGPQVR